MYSFQKYSFLITLVVQTGLHMQSYRTVWYFNRPLKFKKFREQSCFVSYVPYEYEYIIHVYVKHKNCVTYPHYSKPGNEPFKKLKLGPCALS